MDKRIEEIRARCEAATPGPWHVNGWSDGSDVYAKVTEYESMGIGGDFPSINDATFVARAREDIPYLLDIIAQREGEVDLGAQYVEELKKEIAQRDATLATQAARLAEMERERDAAIRDMELRNMPCDACTNRSLFRDEGACADCGHAPYGSGTENGFDWRGPAPATVGRGEEEVHA